MLTFANYCEKYNLMEMAQTRDEVVVEELPLDDNDYNFINQAVAAAQAEVVKGNLKKIDPEAFRVNALRTRYTLLPKYGIERIMVDGEEKGMIRFFGAKEYGTKTGSRSGTSWLYLYIPDPKLDELKEKLIEYGLKDAAEEGFTPYKDRSLDRDKDKNKFYDTAFSRNNAEDSLESGKIAVNTKVGLGRAQKVKSRIEKDLASKKGTEEYGSPEEIQSSDSGVSKYVIDPEYFYRYFPKDPDDLDKMMSPIDKDWTYVWDVVEKEIVGKQIPTKEWDEFRNGGNAQSITNSLYSGFANVIKPRFPDYLKLPEDRFRVRQAIMHILSLFMQSYGDKLNTPKITSSANKFAQNLTMEVIIRKWEKRKSAQFGDKSLLVGGGRRQSEEDDDALRNLSREETPEDDEFEDDIILPTVPDKDIQRFITIAKKLGDDMNWDALSEDEENFYQKILRSVGRDNLRKIVAKFLQKQSPSSLEDWHFRMGNPLHEVGGAVGTLGPLNKNAADYQVEGTGKRPGFRDFVRKKRKKR